MRQKINELFEVVKKIERGSNEAASKSSESANEASSGLTASYSAAGDAEHARNTANLSIQKHGLIKKLVEELEEAVNEKVPDTISPVTFVVLEYANGKRKSFYVVENPTYINGYNLISIISPIGRGIGEKKIGDSFSYIVSDEVYAGKILEIG